MEKVVLMMSDILKSLVKPEPQLTMNEIAKRLNSYCGTVFRHLKEIRKVSNLGKWVLHELSEANW